MTNNSILRTSFRTTPIYMYMIHFQEQIRQLNNKTKRKKNVPLKKSFKSALYDRQTIMIHTFTNL